MWTHGVVVNAPGFDQRAGLGDAGKPMLVEALVPKLAVEALDEGVVGGLPRPDEAQLDATGVGPRVECAAAEFGPIVHHENLRQADGLGEPIEHADDAQTGQRPIDFDRDTFLREVVDDVQRAKPRPSVCD